MGAGNITQRTKAMRRCVYPGEGIGKGFNLIFRGTVSKDLGGIKQDETNTRKIQAKTFVYSEHFSIVKLIKQLLFLILARSEKSTPPTPRHNYCDPTTAALQCQKKVSRVANPLL